MSATIDQRVVEMRFDNRHFEQNVSTTMSTLDKLKQKLHLDGATKGLENVNNAAKGVKMDGLGAAVENVSARFSALDVIGVTALANITNSAVNAGKRMLKALTLDPITTGFQEYETQINAVQTILANTESKGSTIDDVNRALEELNKYADMTIYNFTEMTRNIGTFTAAGVDLDTSTNAIKGIANLAAVSGSTSQQASTAMYQLSQALASGTVKLMDWNSVVNAGMGGQVFQDALKETARVHGVAIDSMIEEQGSFRETLSEGWLTSEILTDTLQKFTLTTEGLTEAEIEANREMLRAKGYTDDQIEGIFKLGNTATNAATKVKTFTQLWDVLKESAQSGWSQTWKLIVGDFEEAKSLLTPLTDFLTGFINGMSDARNRVLQIALAFTEPWTTMMDKLNNVKKVVKNVSKVTESLEYFQDIVNKVWRGDYKNSDTGRFELLEKAGYDHRVVQDLVNKGYQYKLTVEDIEASHKKFGLIMETTTEETEKLTTAFEDLSDKKLKDAGLTDDEIALYRAMQKEADRLGISVSELADEMTKTDGRTLLIESFKNFGDIFVGIGKAAKDAWNEIINPPSLETMGIRLYGIIRSLKDFSESLRLTDAETGKLNENGLKFKRIFEGVFALVDIIATVVGGPLKIALKLAGQILGYFGITLLDVLAIVSDVIVKFHDWFEAMFDISGALDKVVPAIQKGVEIVGVWFDAFKKSEGIQKAIKYIRDLGTEIKEWWTNLLDGSLTPEVIAEGIVNAFSNIPKVISKVFSYIREGLRESFNIFNDGGNIRFNGLIEALKTDLGFVGEVVAEIGKILLNKFNNFLSAHGFQEISLDAIAGLVQGFKNGATSVINAAVEMAKNLVQKVKDFLGIHSPSKVFYAIGGFIVAGLIAGLQNGIPDSLGAVKDVFQPMLDWIKGIDFGSLLAGVIGIGTVKAAGTAAGALADFAAPFAGMGEVLEESAVFLKKMTRPIKNVVNGFAKIEKSVAFNMRMDGIKTLATSLLMLVGAIAVLTFFEPAELWNAVGVIAALAAILTALAFAMNKINGASASFNLKDGLNIKGLSTGLIGIGAAILLLGLTVKMVGSLNPEQAKQGFIGLAGLIVAVGVVLTVFGTLVKGKSAQNIDKFGIMMTKMAVALLLLVAVVKLVGKLTNDELISGAIFLGGFIVFLALINTIALMPSKNIGKLGGMMVKISISLLLMVAVVKLAAGLSIEELKSGAIFLGGFAVFVAILAAIGGLGGKAIDGVSKMMLGLSVSLLLMVGVVKLISMLEPGEILKGVIAVAAFATIITLMVKSIMKNGSEAPKVAATILAFSIAIGILAAIAVVCGLIDTASLAKGIVAVGILASMMALLIHSTKGAQNVTGNIIAITVAIGLLVAAVAVLTFIDSTKLAVATTAMTILMGMLALVVKVAGAAQNVWGVVTAITGAILAIGGVLYLLATLPVESTIGSAIALGGLLVIVTGVLALMIPIGKMAQTAFWGIGALAAMAVPLLAFVGVLALMQNVQNALTNAKALTVLATAMTLLLIPLTLVGAAAMSGVPFLGVAALLAMAVPLLAFVGILALMSGIQNGVTNAQALGELMTVIGDVLFKLSLVAPLAAIGVGALTAMVGLITTLGILVTAMGALVTKFPQLQTFLDTGIGLFEQLASGLGRIIGSFITGFAGEVMSILPPLGLCLSQFMINSQPFIIGAKTVDESVLAGVGILAGAVLALTAADLITGVVSFLQGGASFADLGTQLSQFMVNALPFITMAQLITPEMMTGVKTLAETILILTAADVLQGLTSWLTGGSSLENFATQLPILGQGLAAFSTNLGTFAEEQLTTVDCAAKAIKTLAQASSEIPNTGGLLGQLVGENDLGVFAAQFPILGSGLAQFLSNIGTFTDEQLTTVDCAANAIKTLAQASSEIPNTGGLLGQLVGENGLGTFAEQFPILGTGLAAFLRNIGTFSDDQVATVDCAANAIKSLAQASSDIPNAGGWLAAIVGDNELGTFAEQLPKVGEGIKGFVNNLGAFTSEQVSSVRAAVSAISALSGLANADLKGAKKHLEDFGNDLPAFAKNIAEFCSNLPSSISMTTAVTNIDKLLAAVESIGNANSGCLSTFADDLKKVGTNAVKKFVEAFTSTYIKTDLKRAAKELVKQVVDGIEAKEDTIKTAAKKAAKKAVEGVETQEDNMKSAGKDLGKGLVKGIKAKWDDAYDAGYTLGQKAVQGEKDGQQSKSPSKLTILAGQWLGEGLVIGMGKMSRQVYNAGSGLGKTATGTISSAVSKIADLVNTDIDSQPTIRPVLDLSDVRSGVNSIGNMFAGANGIGVQANVSAISSMMNTRGQNGVNGDVVSAIDKLRKDLSNVGGNHYSINGINVSEGTDAADAIHTLVRVIKMEGRS